MDKNNNLHKFNKKFNVLGSTKVIRIPEVLKPKISLLLDSIENRAEFEYNKKKDGLAKVNQLLDAMIEAINNPINKTK